MEYKCALQIDVKNVSASLGLGRCYLAEKDFQRASGAFNAALELDPAAMRLDQLLAICSALQLELVVQTKAPADQSATSSPAQEW